jgi:hypothetical protein
MQTTVSHKRYVCDPQPLRDASGNEYLDNCTAAPNGTRSDTGADHHCMDSGTATDPDAKRCYKPLPPQTRCRKTEPSPSEYDGRPVLKECYFMARNLEQRRKQIVAYKLDDKKHVIPSEYTVCRSSLKSNMGSECITLAAARSAGATSADAETKTNTDTGANDTGTNTNHTNTASASTASASTASASTASASTASSSGSASTASANTASNSRDADALCAHVTRTWRRERGFVSSHYDRKLGTCYAKYDRPRSEGDGRYASCVASFAWAHDKAAASRLLAAEDVPQQCLRVIPKLQIVLGDTVARCRKLGNEQTLCPLSS